MGVECCPTQPFAAPGQQNVQARFIAWCMNPMIANMSDISMRLHTVLTPNAKPSLPQRRPVKMIYPGTHIKPRIMDLTFELEWEVRNTEAASSGLHVDKKLSVDPELSLQVVEPELLLLTEDRIFGSFGAPELHGFLGLDLDRCTSSGIAADPGFAIDLSQFCLTPGRVTPHRECVPDGVV